MANDYVRNALKQFELNAFLPLDCYYWRKCKSFAYLIDVYKDVFFKLFFIPLKFIRTRFSQFLNNFLWRQLNGCTRLMNFSIPASRKHTTVKIAINVFFSLCYSLMKL